MVNIYVMCVCVHQFNMGQDGVMMVDSGVDDG